MPPIRPAFLLWTLALLSVAGAVSAQPTVLVRADTRIELRVERRLDGSVHLVGTLRDDLGATLAGVPIDVAAWSETLPERGRHWTAHPRTDTNGSFDVVFGPEDGWWASASFAGNEVYLPTEARQRLDLRLAHVSLTVHVEDRGILDLDEPQHTVRVTTESSAGGADLHVSLRNELGVVLAEGVTDLGGAVVLVVGSEQLGPPSAGRLVALSAADALRSAAQAEVPIVRLRPTHLSLELVSRTDERVVVRGELGDSRGGRAREAVGLYAGERHLGTASTEENGSFEQEFPLEAVSGLGSEVPLVARFSSDAPWIGASVSAPVVLSFRPNLVDTTTVLGIVSVSIALGLLAFLVLGQRRATVAEAVPEPGRSSISLGTRVRERVVKISGRVEDARTGAPIGPATIRVGDLEAVTGADGSFELEPAVGRHALAVEAVGYERFETTAVVPHRGEHSGTRIRLVSLRYLALAPLRPIAIRLLPSAELWSLWTQRELLGALRKAGREPAALATLIDLVERACYGPTPPALAEIAAIRALASEVEQQLPVAPANGGAASAAAR